MSSRKMSFSDPNCSEKAWPRRVRLSDSYWGDGYNLNMILPYYNCLLVIHRYSEIEIGEEEDLIKDYLEEALRGRKEVETTILVSNLGDRNSSLLLRMHNILHMLLTNLAVEVHELSNSYTQSQQTKMLYDSLEQITLSPNQNNKIPLLDNIGPLQSYYSRYSSQQEMKEFLKKALIEELNADKKIIRYRTNEQVQLFLKRQVQALQGQIKLISEGSPAAGDIFILLVSHKQAQPEALIQQLERNFPINQDINADLTSKCTLSKLQLQAQKRLSSLFSDLFLRGREIILREIISLKATMLLQRSLAAIIILGNRLQQDEAQREQFLAFVSQMNAKYTKELQIYFQAFHQQLLYRSSQQQHRQRQKNLNKIQSYLLGFTSTITLERQRQAESRRKCSLLETAISAFLLRRKARRVRLELYLANKREQRAKSSAMYLDIRNLLNEMQLDKVRKYNGHKYGFRCCLFILELSGVSNSPSFSPMLLLKQLQKLSKRTEPLVRINCYENSLQFVTLQGKVLRVGKSLPQPYLFETQSSEKQNIDSNFTSIVEQLSLFPSSLQRVELTKKKDTHSYLQNRQAIRKESETFKQFQYAHPSQQIISSTSEGDFGIFITKSGKLFHWGKGHPRFPQSLLPQPSELTPRLTLKQALIGTEDVFLLTSNNKVYSSSHHRTIRLPKQVQQQFDHFHLVKSRSTNLSVCYLLAYRSESQDRLKLRQIQHFLTVSSPLGAVTHDSMLMDSCDKQLGQIQEISQILQESLFC